MFAGRALFDPGNNRLRNLRGLCQRCHLRQDRAYHLLQRWITYRLRNAAGDLFLGPYRHGREAIQALPEILARIARSGRGAPEWGRAVPFGSRRSAHQPILLP